MSSNDFDGEFVLVHMLPICPDCGGRLWRYFDEPETECKCYTTRVVVPIQTIEFGDRW
jgi:hypothetical protein